MISFSASSNFRLQSPPPRATAFAADNSPSPPSPSVVKFRQPRSSSVCAVATAAYAEEETEAAAFSSSPPLHPEIESPSSATSFYEILGIPVGATSEDIKAAYRRLARVCHPDVAGSRRKDASGDEFMKIHAAYSTLSDPGKRADYDRQLFLRRRSVNLYSSPTMSSRFAGNSRRNWETDQCW
ncbi:chaperone protein dnaJ 11, chloroplastic-like [Ipomoea triloba]|uniref:chaperone protein dnaJ 11, chloroplastic-like n=1 Tax=Ipomoea triloba TaxID=35885 RepID=UPI00125E67AD|nr:chaperone protein dnaJ 11, chloroplastic-like [Ipomoea triloba]